MTYQLPNLPYEYNALEPVISEEIMRIHHTKHHLAYVNNLNAAIEKYKEAEAKQDIAQMIALEKDIKFNGGGHINHSIFWTNLAPKNMGGGQGPQGDLLDAIQLDFGGFQNFMDHFSKAAIGIQGSGWCWLGYDKVTGQLRIVTCQNQDPLSTLNLVPLLGIDVWEHAYYLQYKNVRADYVKAIWSIINWTDVARRFSEAIAKCSGCSCK